MLMAKAQTNMQIKLVVHLKELPAVEELWELLWKYAVNRANMEFQETAEGCFSVRSISQSSIATKRKIAMSSSSRKSCKNNKICDCHRNINHTGLHQFLCLLPGRL